MSRIIILPGDGIGPDIVREAVAVLDLINDKFNLNLDYEYGLAGGASIDESGEPVTDGVLEKCKQADAVLLGAVGGPRWESTDPGKPRPEDALLALRKGMGLYANLRPVKIFNSLVSASALKPQLLEHVDILVVRELTGGIYFGPRNRIEEEGHIQAFDTMLYADYEIERITRLAFEFARQRRKKVTSIDKANILESSRLWREIVIDIGSGYPDVELNHLYVDNATMQLIRDPGQFDVVLASNMFGDILSDEAAMISGSIGLLPSASLRQDMMGMYEPIHGSAPDITGEDKANPIAAILSVALMLKYTFRRDDIYSLIEKAVGHVLDQGYRTSEIYQEGKELVGTSRMGQLIISQIKKSI
ncbi:MAG: 3-isopropylmalate dehydrogenase [Actinomycetia bacterium]|nr:3-isopropylmalate dehydrogenase [Actinomycetes bacterium]